MQAFQAFLDAIPKAASNPLALAAYAIAAVLFLLTAEKIIKARHSLKALPLMRSEEIASYMERMHGVVLPRDITAEQWLRHHRQRNLFGLLGALLIAVFTVVVIAILNPAHKLAEVIDESLKKTEIRLAHPLEDAEVSATLRLSKHNKRLAEYTSWLEKEFSAALDERGCYDLNKNPLRIRLVTTDSYPLVDAVCHRNILIDIPTNSPLFPKDLGLHGPVVEMLARIQINVELFAPQTRRERYRPSMNDGLLLMQSGASATVDEPGPRGLLLRFDSRSRELFMLAERLTYTKKNWKYRDQSIQSLLDLAGKEVVFWAQIGTKDFFSDEVDEIRSSSSLENLVFRMGALKFAPAHSDLAQELGRPVWVSVFPGSVDELLQLRSRN